MKRFLAVLLAVLLLQGDSKDMARGHLRRPHQVRALFLAILLALSVVGCTNEDASRKALEAQGFTNIEILGWGFMECSEDDFYSTEFRAVNPAGKVAEGTVCCGFFFKNCTVRW